MDRAMYEQQRAEDILAVEKLTFEVRKKKRKPKRVKFDRRAVSEGSIVEENSPLRKLQSKLTCIERQHRLVDHQQTHLAHPSLPSCPWDTASGKSSTISKSHVNSKSRLINSHIDDQLKWWLKSCDNNVTHATSHVFRTLQFRRKRGLDHLLCDYHPPDILSRNYPGGICGEDRDGSPVSYEMPGRLDLAALMTSLTKEDLITFKLWQYEVIKTELKMKSKVRGKVISNILLVVDLRDLHIHNFWSPGLAFWVEILQLTQIHYPSMVKEIIIINPNGLFPDFYLALSPYLGYRLRQKLTVLGSNYLRHLLLRIEKHELPGYLGGYKADSNGNKKCHSCINWNTKMCTFDDDPNPGETEQILVLGGGRKVKENHVIVPCSVMTWHVENVNRRFIITVYRDTLGDPGSKVMEATITPQDGSLSKSLTCPIPGRYYLVIDNSRNLAHTLTLDLILGVEVPARLADKLEPNAPLGDFVDFSGLMSSTEKQMARDRYLQQARWKWLEPIDDLESSHWSSQG